MPQKTNLNAPPYNDDFDASKKYYKVLFRPGYSIQTRELTTLQSVLQNQIENIGRSRFKQGQQVIPGEVSFNNRLDYVKLSSVSEVAVNINGNVVFQKYDIKNLEGATIQGLTSGVTATVISYAYGSAVESDILFVKYTNSGTSSTEFTFRQGETLEALNISNTPTLVVGTDGSVLPTTISVKDYDTGLIKTIDSPAMGYASAVQVESGVYFINGYFVNNSQQLIVVDKYYNKPSVKVGFNITESIVTPEQDKSLYDNSRGFSNFSAPGAHRLKIDLSLISSEYDALTDENYVQLISIKNGEIQQLVKPTDYNLIEETLARRTYDESGDYVVDNFSLDLREYYLRNNNKGTYPLNQETNLVNKKTIDEAEALMVAGVGPGKAYIKGYEIVNKDVKYLEVSKARETLLKEDNKIKTNSLAYFNISNTYGSVPLNAEGQELTAYPTVFLNSVYNDGSIGLNNTESSLDKKQTVVRRSSTYSIDEGVITLTLDNPSKFSSASFPTSSNFGTSNFNKLWYVVNKGTAPASTTVRSVDLLSFSVVERPFDITNSSIGSITAIGSISAADATRNPGTYTIDADEYTSEFAGFGATFQVIIDSAGAAGVTLTNGGNNFSVGETITILPSQIGGAGANLTFDVSTISSTTNYLELTVKGNKEDIYSFFKEYDDSDSSKKRKLFSSENDAKSYYFQTGTPTIFPYSEILDYNEIITPVIGVCKPKDFSLIEKGVGFNKDTDKVASKGRLSTGVSTYNSVFRFSYFNPTFFTRLVLDSDLPIQSVGFSSGSYVVGATSGAYGIVEGSSTGKYSIGNILLVKTLSGKFNPGETIIDEKGNARRIAVEGTISHFVVMNRGGGFPTTTTLSINGVAYDSSTIEIGVTAGTIYKVNVKNRNLLSTVYSTPPEITFNTGNVTPAISAVVKPILFRNTVYTYNPENVKSLHSLFGAGNAYTFTADVETFNNKYISTKTVTDFTFSGKRGQKYLTCNGFSGDPSSELFQGDVIQFTDDLNNSIRVIVQKVEKAEGLIKSKIYIDNVLRDDVSNSSVVRIRPRIENSSISSLIIPTGSKYLNSIVQNSEDSKINYYFRRDFVTTASTSGGNITFAAQLPYGTQRFASFTEENFILTVLDKKSSTTVESGDILYLSEEQVTIENTTTGTSGSTAGSVKITLPSSYFGTSTNFPILKLTATLKVSKSRPRLKTIYRNKRILVVSPGDRIVPIRGVDYDSNSTDTLSYSDVTKVYKIYEGTVQTPPVISATNDLVTGTDVTERFSFDDGQRDTFYDVSRLVLKPGFDPPTGQLIIIFDYFEHSQGDFCTVDSYLHEAGVGLDEIPNFNSNVYGKISLRDVFDFRPKVDSSATISGYQDTSILSLSDYCSFTGSAGITTSTPATEKSLDYTINFNLKQYLDRIDGVYLDKKGNFFIKEGNPSLNPTKPEDVSDAVALYYLYVPSYTITSSDVKIIPVDNRRYTMRDIGKLEKRIERLEQYTLLSVLEQQALNMQVKDDLGIDKFKSGFIVDNFENHGVGNVASDDYKCAIDSQQSTLRPKSVESSFALKEVNTTDEERVLDNYKKTGPIITLPYTSVSNISNPYATKTININPFVVLQYVGDASLTNPIDSWYDDKETPIILDNDSKLFSVFYAKSDSREGFASIHNNFIVNWVGTDRVFFNVSSLNNISTFTASSSTIDASVSSSSNISPQNNQLAQGINTKKVGLNSVGFSLQQFCRSVPIFFNLTRMKPSTKFYVFIDGKNIDRWVMQDYRYTGVAGNSLSTFNSGITTDLNGNASGMILMPSGYPPQTGSTWNNDINSVVYDTELGTPLSFIVGEKSIRFTSSSTDEDVSQVSSYAETKYYATGILPQQPPSIISTVPAILKSAEGIQLVESSKTQAKPNPLSQTFSIEKVPGGLFVTGMDLFFNKKSDTIPVKVYLTNVESGKPGKYIIPGSECVLNPDTYLKIYTNGTVTLTKGEIVTGASSSASGPISKIYDKNGVELLPSTIGNYTLSNDQVYTLILNNHNGKSFLQNEDLTISSLVSYNAANATSLKVTIARDSGRITGLNIMNSGIGYETASLTIESPQLIGGVNATATCKVSDGNIYDTTLIVGGSGYTEAPSVIITSTGVQASGADIQAILEIDSPAVRMGVAVDPGTTTVSDSTTPTHFVFQYPVYLQNNTEYSFCVESDSTDYSIWASRLGEKEIALGSTVSAQPLLGSVFKSQNVDVWTEDLFEDIKFNLYRAEFDNTVSGVVTLSNENLGYEPLDITPIETDSLSDTTATSQLFKNNNKIVKIRHQNNGFESSGKSFVAFRNVDNVGGINSESLTNTLYEVSNVGSDFYTISSVDAASSNAVGGGNSVLALYNRKYEKLYPQVSYLNFNDTSISAEVKTTNILPIDTKITSYSSYSQLQENDGYEKTFLNQEHYFNNQKVLTSRINELKNSNSIEDRSLSYKITMSSKNTLLSPVIDLRTASVKLVNNKVEKSSGYEERYGRRDQVIKFYPVYKFSVGGANSSTIEAGDTGNPKIVKGNTSGASGIIVKFVSSTNLLYVKMLTDTLFTPSETLTFGSQPSLTTVSVGTTGVTEETFSFNYNSVVEAIDKTDVTQKYTNIISGRVILWDAEKKELTVSNNKNPINNNYTSAATPGSDYARIPFSSSSEQQKDIFRVGDLLGYENQLTGTEGFLEIKSVSYTTGALYVPEIDKNSSSIAKYVTKEINLENSGTGIDVRLTANIFEEDDIQVLYKIKPVSSQFNFDDLGWQFFNSDGSPDVRVIPSSENTIAGYIEDQKTYKEYKFSASNLNEFSSFAIKIIMRSSNPVYVPKVQDVRIVASF